MKNKFSNGLKDLLKKSQDPTVVVIIELNSLQENGLIKTRQNQTQDNFSIYIKSIEDIIKNKGGDILSTAWLNQTIKARIPKDCLNTLSNLSSVSTIDIPNRIKRDIL